MRLVVARLGKSLYEVVGVARGASNVEIKKVRRAGCSGVLRRSSSYCTMMMFMILLPSSSALTTNKPRDALNTMEGLY